MSKKRVIKQHFIPRMILKRWSTDECYFVYNIKTKLKKDFVISQYYKDPFHDLNFYEHDNFKINEIENRLSLLENEYSQILKLIENKDKVKLTRYQNTFLRLFSFVEVYRSQSSLSRSKNLEGGIEFNNYYKNKTFDEIKLESLEQLHYLIFDIFDYNKKYATLLDEKQINFLQDLEKKIEDLIKKEKTFSEIVKIIIPKSPWEVLTINMSNIYKSQTKFIKIPESISEDFILTDSQLVEFYNENAIVRYPILTIKIINPKLAIAYIGLNYLKKINGSKESDEGFWEKIFENLFETKPEVRYVNFEKIKDESFINGDYFSGEDIYIFEPYIINNNRQVRLINAMMFSQASELVVYTKNTSIEGIIDDIDKNNIFRIENLGL